jgi:histidinol-phosphate aminotransferase
MPIAKMISSKKNTKNGFNVCTINPWQEFPELSRREFARSRGMFHTRAVRINPSLKNLPTYQPGRPIEEVARELNLPAASIIKVASNENPFGPSPLALAAMQKALAGMNLYPDGNAFYMKQKLAAKLGIEPANLILGNGSNEIIEFVSHALLGGVDNDANIVVSQYCFAIYPIVAKMFGATVINVPARKYGHDLPVMLRAITPQTRIVFIANPNNPTGTLAPREEVIQFVNDVPDDVLLVMDEAYIEFLDDAVDLVPLIRLGTRKNLLLMRTFSKIYGLAGLRIGYGIGSPDLVSAFEKIRQPFNVNSLSQVAAIAALDDDEHVRKTRANNFAGLEFLGRAFRELKLEFVPSHANFILVRVGDGAKVFEAMQRQGVIVRPMGGYQLPEWIRVSVGTPQENGRCLTVLKEVLQ